MIQLLKLCLEQIKDYSDNKNVQGIVDGLYCKMAIGDIEEYVQEMEQHKNYVAKLSEAACLVGIDIIDYGYFKEILFEKFDNYLNTNNDDIKAFGKTIKPSDFLKKEDPKQYKALYEKWYEEQNFYQIDEYYLTGDKMNKLAKHIADQIKRWTF